MAASAGIAKRATIDIGTNFDQTSIDRFEHSLKSITHVNTDLRDAFDRTNQAFDRFNEHITGMANHNEDAMRRLRHADNVAVEAEQRFSRAGQHTAAVHNREADKIDEDNRHMVTSSDQQINHLIHNNERLKSQLNSIGRTSEHVSNHISSANGRSARSFRYSNAGIHQHEQSIRNAQGRDYRWLRTAQDMSGATLGLGAAFYKGAKDATTLQQAYIHAGNMAHYGGEKVSQVQHDINQQWRTGSNLSVKYGISQDQIAKGYQALVARGYTTNESLHTQKSLLQAAIASGDDYNDVVKDSTNVLDAYNMRSQNATTMTNNTKRVVNEMAYAADQTATNFRGLGIGMSYVAATAHTTHQPISETSSALGILSNKGMQASMAGVGLRKVLNSFLSVNKKGQQAQAMQQMGLSENDFKTASGHLKSLGSLMSLMNDKTKNMDSQQRGAIFHRFFGATGQEAALNLASDTKGLAQLNSQVQKSQTMGSKQQGYVALLSQHNMKSAQNQFNKFKQAWQAFTITSARTILPEFTGALKHLDIWIGKLNDMSPRAKKWTIWSAIAIGAISPVSFAIFGVQSAFHGLEMTLLHVRHIFSRPVSDEMGRSMTKQEIEDEASSKLLDNGGKTAGLSRVARYDRGGIGYRAINLAKSHPAVSSVGGATTLAVGMGTFMGLNANHEAAKQVHNKIRHEFHSPIQQRIQVELDKAGVNRSLEGNKRFTKKMREQDDSIYSNINSQLVKENNRNNNYSKRNVANLLKYGAISKRQAKSLLNNDKRSNSKQLSNAKRAINRITKEENRGHKVTQRDYKNAAKAINHIIAGNGSKQTQIFRKLQRNTGKLSTKTAARLLSDSYKEYRGQVRGANKSYDGTKSAAWKRYDTVTKAAAAEYGKNSSEYDKIQSKESKIRKNTIHGAYERKKWTVYYAKQEHNRTVSEAEKQRKGLNRSVDLSTGHMKTEWSTELSWFHNTLAPGFKHVFSVIGESASNTLSTMTFGLSHKVGHFAHNVSQAAGNAHEFGRAHATGGFIPRNEMSLVGEQGPETAYNPRNGEIRLLGVNGPQITELLAGEHVLTNTQTRKLLNGGLGRDIRLPGYAMGTGRASAISSEESSEPDWVQHLDSNLVNTASSFSPSNILRVPSDTKSLVSSHNPFNAFKSGADLLGDLPGAGLMKSVKGGMTGTKLGAKLLPHLSGFKDLASASGRIQSIGESIGHPVSNLMQHLPIIHSVKGILHKLPGDFKEIWPKIGKSMSVGRKFMGKLLVNPIKHGVTDLRHNIPKWSHNIARSTDHIWSGLKRGASRGWNGFTRISRRALSGAGRLLRRAGSGIRRFGKRTWSGAKRLGSRLWSGSKHVAGRIWSSTKQISRNIWNSTKRVSKNIWNGSKHLASRIGTTARSVWNKTKSGAHRMATNVGHVTTILFRETRSKARSAWSNIKSGARSAVSFGHHMISGLVSAAHSAASHIRSLFSHIHMPHFATGGMIHRSTMALVGEHGPETAYNARNGSIRLLGTRGPQITTLLAGERVLTANQTSRLLHGGIGKGIKLPAFARGTMTRLSRPSSRLSQFGIVGSFNGNNAIKEMTSFGKRAKSIWNSISSKITKISSDLSDSVNDIFKDMKHKVTDLSDDLKSGLIQAAKDTAEGFGDKFKKLITYARDDMESVIEKLNRGVSGIDRALRAFGGNSHVIHPIHYATGTMNGRIAYNQLGILNDSITGPRQEAILRGNHVLMPRGNNVPVPLQKGDAVLNGTQTKQMIDDSTTINHYAKGSGLHINMKHLHELVHVINDAIKGPASFFRKTFNGFVGNVTGHQLTRGIEQLGLTAIKPLGNQWTGAMFNYIKNLLNPTANGGSSNSVLLNEMHKLGDGHTYLWGASGPTHYDCGGLVMAALHHLGMPSEHTVYPYPRIPESEATTGDIVQSATHVGVVADPHHRTYFSAYGPNLAKDSIKTQPLTNEYFTPGHPYYFRRPWKLYHEDQRNKAQKQGSTHRGNHLETLVKSELGSTAIKWLKKAGTAISDFSDLGSATNPPGESVGRWRPDVKKVLSALHLSTGDETVDRVLRQISTESSGNPNAVGGTDGLPDGRAMGLMQVKPGTFAAYGKPSLGKWNNGLASIYAGLNYAKHRYGTLSVLGNGHGYANGGWANKPSIFGEAGPEIAINPNRDSADHWIVQAIAARIHQNGNSPIASLIKSMKIKKRGHALMNSVKDMLMNEHPRNNYKTSKTPISVHLSIGHININGASNSTSKIKLRHEIQKIAQDAIQRAALEARNRLSW